MRKIISHLIISLDGVAKLDAIGDLIKELRNREEVLSDFFGKVAEEDAMILGRKTYQEWANYWPTSSYKPFASHVNVVPKYVASKTLDSVPWGSFDDAHLLQGDLPEAVAALKRQPGKNIGVHGSPTLVGAMLQQNLIDELRLEIYPVIAGSGPRLFQDRGEPKLLALVDSKVTSNGVAILTYRADT
jgi:dihydrofolate reductase